MNSAPWTSKKARFIHFLTWATAWTGLTGCAGPHTPLGAVWSFWPVQPLADRSIAALEKRGEGPSISFSPSRQILHGPSPVTVAIQDTQLDFENYHLSVLYNGFEVTETFLRRAKRTHKWQERQLVIQNPVVRLPSHGDHLIEFTYRNPQGDTVSARYESPSCNAYVLQEIATTGAFRPRPEMLRVISQSAREEGINPALVTGLIAQESRFDPRQVSWAKAIGLTQITTSAEKEISSSHDSWPRYPGIETMAHEDVRILIAAGKINATNEWRVNPALSVKGGVEFLELLSKQWSNGTNSAKIHLIFHDREDLQVARTRLVLASYHSGYSRVKTALETYGVDWLKAPELREARKYVNRIFSYCNHFGSDHRLDGQAS